MSLDLTSHHAPAPSAGLRHRERHEMPVRSVVRAWGDVPDDVRSQLRRSLPKPVLTSLLRLVDPVGLRGHSDAMALADVFRRLSDAEVEELSGQMPFRLFWAVARLSQNLR